MSFSGKVTPFIMETAAAAAAAAAAASSCGE